MSVARSSDHSSDARTIPAQTGCNQRRHADDRCCDLRHETGMTLNGSAVFTSRRQRAEFAKHRDDIRVPWNGSFTSNRGCVRGRHMRRPAANLTSHEAFPNTALWELDSIHTLSRLLFECISSQYGFSCKARTTRVIVHWWIKEVLDSRLNSLRARPCTDRHLKEPWEMLRRRSQTLSRMVRLNTASWKSPGFSAAWTPSPNQRYLIDF